MKQKENDNNINKACVALIIIVDRHLEKFNVQINCFYQKTNLEITLIYEEKHEKKHTVITLLRSGTCCIF